MKMLEAYTTPPNFQPISQRWSRDIHPTDILPTDPVFVLRARQSSQEIIAAQRAASRANQKALIHANTSRGVDVVLPDKGTLRSSLLPEGLRYSYIDGDGETYDIGELLEEECAEPPPLLRTATDSSAYHTAPSTPEPADPDILRGVMMNQKGEEKLQRVINKVKQKQPPARSIPLQNTSKPIDLQQTAETVNRIVSRHRQQPSIASILSIQDESKKEPTPFPRVPVTYKDNFGIKAMVASIEARARDMYRPIPKVEVDEVESLLWGVREVDIHPDIQICFAPLQTRLDALDLELDTLLSSLIHI
jgi:hypothetical protein